MAGRVAVEACRLDRRQRQVTADPCSSTGNRPPSGRYQCRHRPWVGGLWRVWPRSVRTPPASWYFGLRRPNTATGVLLVNRQKIHAQIRCDGIRQQRGRWRRLPLTVLRSGEDKRSYRWYVLSAQNCVSLGNIERQSRSLPLSPASCRVLPVDSHPGRRTRGRRGVSTTSGGGAGP